MLIFFFNLCAFARARNLGKYMSSNVGLIVPTSQLVFKNIKGVGLR